MSTHLANECNPPHSVNDCTGAALLVRSTVTGVRTALIVVILIANSTPTPAADNTERELARAEQRMKEEKRRDEQYAKDLANRVKVARFDSVWRSPRTNDIDVVQAHEPVAKLYKSIALLTFDCETKEETQAVAGFIAKAKDLGADGIRFMGFEHPSIQQVNVVSPDERRVFRANAIVYQQKE